MQSSWLSPMGQISSMPSDTRASSQLSTGQRPPDARTSCEEQQKSPRLKHYPLPSEVVKYLTRRPTKQQAA